MSGSVHSPSNAPVVSWDGVGGVSSFRSDWTNGNQTHSELIEVADCTMQMPTTTSFPLGPYARHRLVCSHGLYSTGGGGGGGVVLCKNTGGNSITELSSTKGHRTKSNIN